MGKCANKTLTHPEYQYYQKMWEKIRICFEGEERVKCEGECFLPKTPGMVHAPDGQMNYDHYRLWANFYEYPASIAVKRFGLLNKERANIEGVEDSRLDKFINNMDGNGLNYQQILEQIHNEQLEVGRVGYLLDGSDERGFDVVPHVVKYSAESIVDWDYTTDTNGKIILTLVVLNESKMVRNEKGKWEYKEMYRVCRLDEGSNYFNYVIDKLEDLDLSAYPAEFNQPMISGKVLDFIPFTFINETDILPCPSRPSSDRICNLSLSLYRKDADYSQTLHEQSQQTPYGTGTSLESINTGTGAYIHEADPQAKFGYIGIGAESLDGQRTALIDLHNKILEESTILLDGSKESGEALSIRMTSKTANLTRVAKTATMGLQQIIKQSAEWLNLATDDIEVIPNLDFASSDNSAQDLMVLWQAKQFGAPFSRESWHRLANKWGLTELSLEDEESALADEDFEPNINITANNNEDNNQE